eukprot:m.92460 g.92460  ORF g.92460 m.92460 type:complete len:1117 (+) comp8512_c0_seq2:3638-6988(+)
MAADANPAPPVHPWHALSADEAYAITDSSSVGLSRARAAELLASCGPNRLTLKENKTVLLILWQQIYSIITAILIAAAAISAGFEDWAGFGFIVAVIVANVGIGTVQEAKAESATQAIAAMTTPTALALRGGHRETVDASTLVVGDIVILKKGERVPADVRLVHTANLRVIESALTGESLAVTKMPGAIAESAQLGDRTCMAYMGTFVIAGDGLGLVVATGDHAELGRINAMMSAVKEQKTPLQQQIDRFGLVISIACLSIAALTFFVAKFARDETTRDSFTVAIGIAIALIPESLPTVVTVALALGVQILARHKAIVRQLPAVETLGAISCICSDKTGTLTRNEMTAVRLHTASVALEVTGLGYNPDGQLRRSVVDGESKALDEHESGLLKQLLLPALLCNDATLTPKHHTQALLRHQDLTLPHLEHTVSPVPQGDLVRNQSIRSSHVNLASTDLDGAPAESGLQWDVTGDPTESALLALVMKSGINFRTVHSATRACPRLSSVPFASDYKFMVTINDVICTPSGETQRMMFVKGAADVLLPLCTRQAVGLDPTVSEPMKLAQWKTLLQELASQGLRVLAVCQRAMHPDESLSITPETITRGAPSLQLNCLAAIVDPPREEAISAIKSCKTAGITVKMITGDHAATAATIGKWLGIETTEVLTGPQLQEITDEELLKRVEGCNIFARTSPEHKLRIVSLLQQLHYVVAMTGDGVNDGPALRQANIGVAMGLSGTEVAKEAARIILQDDNFATFEVAIRLGRTTYDNLLKLMMFLLPTSIAQGFSVAVATYIGVQTPLTNVQILFVNMVTAATLGLVLAAEKPEDGVMNRPPRRPGKQLLGKHVVWRSLFVGTLMIVSMLGQYAWTKAIGDSDEVGHTMAMNTLVVSQCLYCLSCRYITKSSLSWEALVGNRWLAAFVVLNIAIQFFLTYTPGVQGVWGTEGQSVIDWLRVLLFAVVIFALVELEKRFGPALIRPHILPAMRYVAHLFHPRREPCDFDFSHLPPGATVPPHADAVVQIEPVILETAAGPVTALPAPALGATHLPPPTDDHPHTVSPYHTPVLVDGPSQAPALAAAAGSSAPEHTAGHSSAQAESSAARAPISIIIAGEDGAMESLV